MTPEPQENRGSLWTTSARATGVIPKEQFQPNPNVTAKDVQAAVDRVKDRAATFSGRVSEHSLRASVESSR